MRRCIGRTLAGALLVSLTAIGVGPYRADASHETIYTSDLTWGASGVPWNGFKVYLSSPRHRNSGARGECSNGWEENINGRHFGYQAAAGDYYQGSYDPGSANKNIKGRGYMVQLSRNTPDDGYLANRDDSNNWGSNLHLVVHTNATTGCGQTSGNYLLTMHADNGNANSNAFASIVRTTLDPVVPNGSNQWGSGVTELYANATWRAYLELQFHDNWDMQSWIRWSSKYHAWRVGWAIDSMLGYP